MPLYRVYGNNTVHQREDNENLSLLWFYIIIDIDALITNAFDNDVQILRLTSTPDFKVMKA